MAVCKASSCPASVHSVFRDTPKRVQVHTIWIICLTNSLCRWRNGGDKELECKVERNFPMESLNKSSAEHVANKIGMIIRRATEGRSLAYDAKECNAVSARFCRHPKGRGFAGGPLCQAPGEGGAPERCTRGPRSGIGQRRGCDDRAYGLLGRASRCGSHLPLEGTAPPYAVAPFASSPFAPPILQSRRRAHGRLIQRFLIFGYSHA